MTPLDKPSRSVSRVTLETLGFHHGADRNKPIIATLAYGDLIVLRPKGTRRPKTVRLLDVYDYAVRCEVNATRMAKLRERKAKLEERRAQAKFRREIRRPLP